MPCSTLFLSMLKCPTSAICSRSTFCSTPLKLTPVDRIAETIGDVVIDVTIDVSSRGHAGGRIEPDRQFDRHTVLAQACSHAIAPDECPTKIMVRTRPLLYSAVACSAKVGQAK